MASARATYKVNTNRKKVHTRKLARAAEEALNRVVNDVLGSLSAGGSAKSSMPSLSKVAAVLRQRLSRPAFVLHNVAALSTLQEIEAAYGRTLPPLVRLEKGVSEADIKTLGLDHTVISIYDKKRFDQIKTMGTTYKNALRKQFAAGLAAGESQSELVKRIQGFKGQNKYRATRIANTESTRIFNEAGYAACEKSTVVRARRWLANLMGGPRKTHEAAHGQVRDMGKPFNVGIATLMYPGDSSGPAEEVVECRCVTQPVIGKPKKIKEPTPTAEAPSVVSMERRISSSPIVGERPLGVYSGHNVTKRVTLKDGTEVAFKPLSGEVGRKATDYTLYNREVAAYDLSKEFGFTNVPVTVQRTYKGKVGSAQLWVKDADFESEYITLMRTKKGVQEKAKMRVFDFILGNTDRHGANYLVKESGELVWIDNGMSMKPYLRSMYNWDQAEMSKYILRLSKSDKKVFYDTCVRLSDKGEAKKVFANLLIEDEAIDLFTDRANQIASKLAQGMSE